MLLMKRDHHDDYNITTFSSQANGAKNIPRIVPLRYLRRSIFLTLVKLLGHADRRVRQEAQFALVDTEDPNTLAHAAREGSNLLARLHGI